MAKRTYITIKGKCMVTRVSKNGRTFLKCKSLDRKTKRRLSAQDVIDSS